MAVWRLWILCGVALLAVTGGSGLIIGGCEEGSVEVVEDSDGLFTCDAYQNSNLLWTFYNDKKQQIFFESCLKWTCNPWSDSYEFSVQQNYYNYIYKLTIKKVTRNSARTFVCNVSSTYARCDLRIIVRPELKDCSVKLSNWMVIGSCTVTGMYSSDNNYTCKWSENQNEKFGGFTTSLTTYTKNSRTYTEGVCSFEKPMPQTTGYYTYSISVSPDSYSYFYEDKFVDGPYRIQLSHNCPEYVFEGSNVSCTCYASRSISPPALLVWEGMDNATLLVKNVSRRLNQQQFTCRLEWRPNGSIKESISYNPNVAYGPSDVLITSYTKKTGDKSERTSLTCTATDVYPSAVFQWNVTCYNQTDSGDSSTCFLNSTQKFESLAILCTASNTYYHQANVSYVFVISTSAIPQASTAGPNAGLIGGVIAAVLVVLIIVAVLIVYIIKRRKGILDRERGFFKSFFGIGNHFDQGPAKSQPYAVANKPQTQPQTQTPIRRQAGPSGDMYTISNTTSSSHVVDDYEAVCKTSFNNTSGTESTGTQLITALKPTTKPNLTLKNNTNVQDSHGTVYMNVTEVPTDSGLGVYHVVPWATMSGSPEPDTSEYSVPAISEEEYNELHFEEDRTGQVDQADNYHHLQIT